MVKALEYYAKAAELGDPVGIYQMGLCYETGHGFPQNFAKAVEWYQKGADMDDTACLTRLGAFYEAGWGVEKDMEKAISCYERAMELGDADAKTFCSITGSLCPRTWTAP